MRDLNPAVLVILVAVVVLGPMAAVTALARLDRPAVDRSDDNLLTTTMRFVGAAVALLCAFVISSLWADLNSARAATRAEGAALDVVLRRLVVAEQDEAVFLVVAYADRVADDEWPLMADPAGSDPGVDEVIDQLFGVVGTIDDTEVQSDVLDAVADLNLARSVRLQTARAGLPAVLWTVLIMGVVVMAAATVAYPSGRSRWAKWLQVSTIGALLAVLLTTIYVLERPWAGPLQPSVAAITQEIPTG